MTDAANEPNDRDPRDEYADVDPEQVADDAIEFFAEEPGDADSPASDADAPPPG